MMKILTERGYSFTTTAGRPVPSQLASLLEVAGSACFALFCARKAVWASTCIAATFCKDLLVHLCVQLVAVLGLLLHSTL